MPPMKTTRPRISPSNDIFEFVRAVQGKNYEEIIGLADAELIAAWRSSHGRKGRENFGVAYRDALESLIALLRSSMAYRPSRIGPELYHQFLQLRERLYPPFKAFSSVHQPIPITMGERSGARGPTRF